MGKCVQAHDGETLSVGKSFAKFLTPKRADDAFFTLLESAIGIDEDKYRSLKNTLRAANALVVGDLPLNYFTRVADRTSNSLEIVVETGGITRINEWVKAAGFTRSSRTVLNGPYTHRGRHAHGIVVVHVVQGPPLVYVLTQPTTANMIFMAWDRVVSLYGETTLLFRKAVVNNFLDTEEDHQVRWRMAGEGWTMIGDVNLLYGRQGDQCLDVDPGVRSVSDDYCTTVMLGGSNVLQDVKWRDQTWRLSYCHHRKSVRIHFRSTTLNALYAVSRNGTVEHCSTDNAEEREVVRQLRVEAIDSTCWCTDA